MNGNKDDESDVMALIHDLEAAREVAHSEQKKKANA